MYEIKKCGYTIQYEVSEYNPPSELEPNEYFVYNVFIDGNEIEYEFEDDIYTEVNTDFYDRYRACTHDRYTKSYYQPSKNPILY